MIAKWKLGSGFLAGLFPSWPQLEMDLSSSSFVTNGSFALKLTRLSFRSRWLTSVLGWALFLRGLRVRRWKCATIHLFRGQCGFQETCLRLRRWRICAVYSWIATLPSWNLYNTWHLWSVAESFWWFHFPGQFQSLLLHLSGYNFLLLNHLWIFWFVYSWFSSCFQVWC